MVGFRRSFSQRNTNLQRILLLESIKGSIGISSKSSKADFSLNAIVRKFVRHFDFSPNPLTGMWSLSLSHFCSVQTFLSFAFKYTLFFYKTVVKFGHFYFIPYIFLNFLSNLSLNVFIKKVLIKKSVVIK